MPLIFSPAGEAKALTALVTTENILLQFYVACTTANGVTNPVVTNAGSGYTSAPTVTITGAGGSGATATAQVGLGGTISSVTITNAGSGYTGAVTVAFSGGGGSGAAATATGGAVPSSNSVYGDFTIATFAGYADKTLTNTIGGTTWSTPAGTPASTQYNPGTPQTETLTSGTATVLGYLYKGVTSSTFYGAEAYASPVSLSVGQPSFTFVPKITQGTQPTPTS